MPRSASAEEAEKLKDVLAEVAPEAMENMPAEDEKPGRYEKLINVKDRGQIFRVDVDTIEHIEAAGDYMCIYTGDNSLILRETMKDLERRLDPRVFQRVHRSTIVNLDQVRQVKPHTNGECFLVLDSGAEVKVSRSTATWWRGSSTSASKSARPDLSRAFFLCATLEESGASTCSARRGRMTSTPGFDLAAFVRATLDEDLGVGLPGGGHDVTAESVIPADARFAGVMDSRDAIIVAGLPFAAAFFRHSTRRCEIEMLVRGWRRASLAGTAT